MLQALGLSGQLFQPEAVLGHSLVCAQIHTEVQIHVLADTGIYLILVQVPLLHPPGEQCLVCALILRQELAKRLEVICRTAFRLSP